MWLCAAGRAYVFVCVFAYVTPCSVIRVLTPGLFRSAIFWCFALVCAHIYVCPVSRLQGRVPAGHSGTGGTFKHALLATRFYLCSDVLPARQRGDMSPYLLHTVISRLPCFKPSFWVVCACHGVCVWGGGMHACMGLRLVFSLRSLIRRARAPRSTAVPRAAASSAITSPCSQAATVFLAWA